MDGLVEVKGIEPYVLSGQFMEKQVFIMSYCILNFSSYFSSQSGIPLTIFMIISPNISSSDLDLVVSGVRGLSFFQLPGLLCYFFLGLTFFQVLGEIFFLLSDFA